MPDDKHDETHVPQPKPNKGTQPQPPAPPTQRGTPPPTQGDPVRPTGLAAQANHPAVMPEHAAPGTAPGRWTSPTPMKAGDLRAVIDRVRHLSADLQAGDVTQAWEDVWAVLDEVRAALKPEIPTFTAKPGDGMKAAPPADPKLKQCADKLEECCQHAEGGTNHPMARAAASGAGSFLQLLMPLLMEILNALFAAKNKPV